MLGALAVGMAATWIWTASQTAWQVHLNRAYVAGLALYETLQRGAPPPPGIAVEPLVEDHLADAGGEGMPTFAGLPSPARVTTMSIITDPTGTTTGGRLQIVIVSPDLQYPVAKLVTDAHSNSAARLGNLARLLASYCSEPVVFAQFDRSNWQRVDGTRIWGCSAAPPDNRLLAVAMVIIGMIVLLSQVAETSMVFTRFSASLQLHERLGGQDAFVEEGPTELREIIGALNEYLAWERDRLEKRALVLSGVSHDLGTPATRLRLRSALIDDEGLRSKLEADIDRMTGMIESVLTYTRSEMNAEQVRRISLTSLVQSIVADYEDVGKPVVLLEIEQPEIDKSRSVFGGGRGNLSLPHDDIRRILVNARPISLQRAISNLIDNSLKYGRRALVSVRADSGSATVVVQDEGTSLSADDLNTLTGPFLRGENAVYVPGVGLGLTIVSTIARQHGGSVSFEKTSVGTRAALKIRRK